jgi:PAS domain S-box-containing protein
MNLIFSNRRLLYITIILIVSNLLIAGISLIVIYNKSIKTLEITLVDMVERQKSLVSVLHEQGKTDIEIIQLIKAMREKHYNIGQTGEFAIAHQIGDSVDFLLALGKQSNFKTNNANMHGLPMRLALQGRNGFVVGEDYRNENVYAAYTFVPILKWGIVAKIPTTEVNSPYYKAIFIGLAISILITLLCVYLFVKISNPIIKSLVGSEETYRMLFDSINDAVFISEVAKGGKTGKFIKVNNVACQRLGYTQEELLSITPFDINSESAKLLIPSLMHGLLEKKHAIIETEHVTKDGRIIPVEISTKVSQFRNKTIIHSIARDITERKQIELELREKTEEIEAQSEEYSQINEELNQTNAELYLAKDKAELNESRLLTFINSIPDVVCYKDGSGKWLLANNANLELFGLTGVDYLGKTDTDLADYTDKVYRNSFLTCMVSDDKCWQNRTTTRLNENIPTLAGEKKTFDIIKTPIFDNAGNRQVLAIVARDITELQNTRDELLAAKEHAEESDRLKTAFLQNMSHEIRTPMNAIMGFSDLLIENYNNKSKLEKFSEIITLRCNDLLDIVNDILDIAKIESGQLPITKEDCSLNELFTELTSFFQEYQKRIGKQQIKFSLQALCDPTENTIITDKVKLKQIFINLISNAFKFTNTGTIAGGCKVGKNNELVFYVSDSGIGIHPDKHEYIFERFTQIKHTKNLAYGGTGLGLSIVKGLVELLGGKIWLESEPEKGTTFYFSFPYKTSHIAPHESIIIEQNQAFHFSGKTILIVEDDRYNTEYIKEILSDTGLNIIHTEFGLEAVHIAISQPLDLVLMDIQLPDMNGYEATSQIKKHKPNLGIIAQTAYAADKQKALDAGCNDYISKPLKRNLLLNMINKQLSKIS